MLFGAKLYPECLLIVQCVLYPKIINWLSDLCCTWRVFIDSWMALCNETYRVFTDFVYDGTWRVFTDCPSCTVPEEGKLINYSQQMSPLAKKELWVFLSFLKVLTNFLCSCPQRVFADCPVWVASQSVDWLSGLCCNWRVSTDIFDGVVQWNFKMLTYFLCFGSWRMFTDYPVSVAPKEY